MKIDIEKNDATGYAKLSVAVSKEDYYPEFQKQLKQYGKNVNLKGFRPGKVPPTLIRNMFGKSIVMEVFNKEVSDQIDAFLKEQEVTPLIHPQVKGEMLTPEQLMRFNEEHQFEMETLYVPPIEIDLSTVSVDSYEPVPTDDDVETELDKLRERMSEQQDVEAIEIGDFVTGIFKQEATQFEEETVLPTNQLTEVMHDLFVGKKVGETVTFDLRTAFPEDKSLKMLFYKEDDETAKLEGEFVLEIQKIQRSVKPELNQDFFDKALGEGEVSSEEEFRQKYKEDLANQYKDAIRSWTENKVREALLEHISFEFNDEMIRKIISENSEKMGTEEVETNMKSFKEFLNWKAITSFFFNKEDLKVEEADVQRARRFEVSQRLGGMSLDQFGDDFIDDLSNRMMENKEQGREFMQNVLDTAILQKTISYFMEKVTIEQEPKSIAELNTIFEKMREEQDAKVTENAEQQIAEENNDQDTAAE